MVVLCIHLALKGEGVARAPWSVDLICHVLDWEVGGSNPGKFVSFSPGRRLKIRGAVL